MTDEISLKEYLKSKLEAIERVIEMEITNINTKFKGHADALEIKAIADKEALRLANDTLRAWQTNSNEWRGAMEDYRVHLITRGEYDQKTAEYDKWVDSIKIEHSLLMQSYAEKKGRNTISVILTIISLVFTCMAVVVALLAYIRGSALLKSVAG